MQTKREQTKKGHEKENRQSCFGNHKLQWHYKDDSQNDKITDTEKDMDRKRAC